jgi:hypothetical protein
MADRGARLLCIATALTEGSYEREDFGQISVGRGAIASNIVGRYRDARDFRCTRDIEQCDPGASGFNKLAQLLRRHEQAPDAQARQGVRH